MERAEKESLVDSFADNLKGAQSVVLTEFRGLTVGEATNLRRSLRQHGIVFRVFKNTLAKRAIAGTPMEVLGPQLEGPVAWAFSETDPILPAKQLLDFLKDPVAAEHLKIKGGYLGGKLLSAQDVEALSKMPGRNELRAKLLSVFNASAVQLVRVLAAGPSQFLNVLKAREQELSKAS
jgi:large subunit ribosomal protein L10